MYLHFTFHNVFWFILCNPIKGFSTVLIPISLRNQHFSRPTKVSKSTRNSRTKYLVCTKYIYRQIQKYTNTKMWDIIIPIILEQFLINLIFAFVLSFCKIKSLNLLENWIYSVSNNNYMCCAVNVSVILNHPGSNTIHDISHNTRICSIAHCVY